MNTIFAQANALIAEELGIQKVRYVKTSKAKTPSVFAPAQDWERQT